ncbi:hypothetical protein [Glutamicibacter halophytocola]
MTELIFPSPLSTGLSVYASGGSASFHDLSVVRFD